MTFGVDSDRIRFSHFSKTEPLNTMFSYGIGQTTKRFGLGGEFYFLESLLKKHNCSLIDSFYY